MKINKILKILIHLCIFFVNTNSINQNSEGESEIYPIDNTNYIFKSIEKKSDFDYFQNQNYFLRQKRNTKPITEDIDKDDIMNHKHIIPDEVEMIDPDAVDNSGTYSIYDETCHVCAKKSIINVPIVEHEINLKPDFRKTKVSCPDYNSVMCVNLNIDVSKVFEVHTKMIGTEEKTQISYECCPGWKNSSLNCCMEPICSQECINGEVCVAPDTCECLKGKNCQENKNNICENLKPCDHLCVNTNTSFICLCKPGFILAADQHSCILNDIYTDDINDPSETRDLENDVDTTYAHKFDKMEKMIENNKKATTDLNDKVRRILQLTDFLNTKISVLEKEYSEISEMEKRIETNEKNMQKFMNFVNSLWRNSKDLFINNLRSIADEDHFADADLY